MPAGTLGAAGHGGVDPAADNTSEDGKVKDRRIEIMRMPLLGEIPGREEMLTGGQS